MTISEAVIRPIVRLSTTLSVRYSGQFDRDGVSGVGSQRDWSVRQSATLSTSHSAIVPVRQSGRLSERQSATLPMRQLARYQSSSQLRYQ